MKEKMWDFITKKYPNAVMSIYITSKWGVELQFYPNPKAHDVYTCIIEDGKLKILTEF